MHNSKAWSNTTMKIMPIAAALTIWAPNALAQPTKMTHDEALAALNAAGIQVTRGSGDCTDRNRRTCTSLEQINAYTITSLIDFAKTIDCPITVTAGTETGHISGTYSHWNGYKVDLRLNDCLDQAIPHNFTSLGNRSDGSPMYRDPVGNVYAREGNHWDVLYRPQE